MKSAGMPNRAVIAIVKGGLGNQLFIYAAARALALRSDRSLYLDPVRGFHSDTYERTYRLNRFPIVAETMPEEWRVAPTLRHPRHKMIRALSKLLPRDGRSYLAERHHLDASQLTALDSWRARVTLLGYWQDEAYFRDHAAAIRSELAVPAPADERNLELGRRMMDGESVFLHIRRVRYTPQLEATYYQNAVDSAMEELENPVFHLFGDDMEWARSRLEFGNSKVEFIEHNPADELADLWLMTCCKHAIVANSSFSWWGAWLGAHSKGGRIWCPQDTGLALVCPVEWTGI